MRRSKRASQPWGYGKADDGFFVTGPDGFDVCTRIIREEDARTFSAGFDMLAALKAAIECGMVPQSSAMEGGANRHVRQLHVADQIRAAIAKAEGRA